MTFVFDTHSDALERKIMAKIPKTVHFFRISLWRITMRKTLTFRWKKETFHQLSLFAQTHKSFCVRTKQMANYLCFDSKDCYNSDSWLMEAPNIFSVYSQINVIYVMYSFAGNSSPEHNNVANVILKMELSRCLHIWCNSFGRNNYVLCFDWCQTKASYFFMRRTKYTSLFVLKQALWRWLFKWKSRKIN